MQTKDYVFDVLAFMLMFGVLSIPALVLRYFALRRHDRAGTTSAVSKKNPANEPSALPGPVPSQVGRLEAAQACQFGLLAGVAGGVVDAGSGSSAAGLSVVAVPASAAGWSRRADRLASARGTARGAWRRRLPIGILRQGLAILAQTGRGARLPGVGIAHHIAHGHRARGWSRARAGCRRCASGLPPHPW